MRRSQGVVGTIILSAVILVLSIIYGFVATQYRWSIADRINEIRLSFVEVGKMFERPIYLDGPTAPYIARTYMPERVSPGLMMIAGINGDSRAFVRVIDRAGTVIYEWIPDWFAMWPDPPEAIPANRRPNRRPAALLHGVRIMENGDVVLNWELLSTFRMSPCGKVLWQKANLGHHSVDLTREGNIVISGETYVAESPTGFENTYAPLNSYTIEVMDQDGRTIMQKPVLEILRDNDLLGLMYQSAVLDDETGVAFDTLHLNEVDVFPEGLESTVFEPGDMMISLRNISTILVVDPDDWRVKFRSTGKVLRQHDPDFAPNDKITVYDNRNMEPGGAPEDKFSRIVELDVRTGDSRVLFQGSPDLPFYSPTLGRQQLQANGNILMIEGWAGHIMEVSPEGELVWDYYNKVSEEFSGNVTEAEILPPEMDLAFFENLRAQCASAS